MASLNDSIIVIKHFCHKCKDEVEVLSAEQRCGRCRTGFVEEIFQTSGTSEDSHQSSSKEEQIKETAKELTDKTECSICLQSIESSEIIVTLVCQHTYHKECIKEWFHLKNNCPLCRSQIDVPTVITPVRPHQTRIRKQYVIRSRSPLSPISGRPRPRLRRLISPISGQTANEEMQELLRQLQIHVSAENRQRQTIHRYHQFLSTNMTSSRGGRSSFTWVFPPESQSIRPQESNTSNHLN